jgi:hypothetical protein
MSAVLSLSELKSSADVLLRLSGLPANFCTEKFGNRLPSDACCN